MKRKWITVMLYSALLCFTIFGKHSAEHCENEDYEQLTEFQIRTEIVITGGTESYGWLSK